MTDTGEFTKTLQKLMNNSTFCKSLESGRKHENITVTMSWRQAERLITKPTFQKAVIFNKNLVVIQKKNQRLTQTCAVRPSYRETETNKYIFKESQSFHV